MSAGPEQPPRAADVPEAVREALHAAWYWVHHEHDANECAGRLRYIVAAIATALREARAHGAADTARLDWLTESSDGWGAIGRRFHRACYLYVSRGMDDFRTALDAARAAEPEPPVTREDGR